MLSFKIKKDKNIYYICYIIYFFLEIFVCYIVSVIHQQYKHSQKRQALTDAAYARGSHLGGSTATAAGLGSSGLMDRVSGTGSI